MKKVIALALVVLLAMSLLCACAETTENGEQAGTSGNINSKELVTQIRYSASWDKENGETSSEEMITNFTWTETGAVLDGYETSSSGKSEMQGELVLDDQKRPAKFTKTVKESSGEEKVTVTEFSYPSDRRITTKQTYYDGHVSETIYEFDANGRRTYYENDTIIRTYTYDDRGNCTLERMEYKDDGDVRETKTAYTYDDAGKVTFAVETYDPSGAETQMHYYYYPNGNVMFIMHVSDRGDLNYQFRPYNTKDGTWSSGMAASGGMEYTAEKDDRGYIVKVNATTMNGEKKTATFTYDDKGNVVSHTTFYGTTYQWEYDAQNRPFKQTRDKKVTVYEYDAQGRLVSEKSTSDIGESSTQTWTYNEAGMVTVRSQSSVSVYDGVSSKYDRKMEVQYTENSQCKVNPQWAEFVLGNIVNGV